MAPPKRRTPRPIQHRPVLAALKAKPCRAARGAGLDRHCAQAASKAARRDEETHPRRTKKPDICFDTKSGHLRLSPTAMQRRIDRPPKQ
jgi:hypothetical protein